MLRPIWFRCFGVWISNAVPCACAPFIVDHIHTQFRLAQISTCAGASGNLLLPKWGVSVALKQRTAITRPRNLAYLTAKVI